MDSLVQRAHIRFLPIFRIVPRGFDRHFCAIAREIWKDDSLSWKTCAEFFWVTPVDDTRFGGPFQGASGTSLGFPHGADGAISRVSNELELFTLRLHSTSFSFPQSHSRENDP